MNTATAEFHIRALRAYGITSPVFDEIAALMLRPYVPRRPAREAIFDPVAAMADGTLTSEQYEAYLLDAAMSAARISEAQIGQAREIRKADALHLLASDGASIGAQLRTLAHAAAVANRAAHEHLVAANVHTEREALSNPAAASAWAERSYQHERHHELIAYLDVLIREGLVPSDPIEQAGAAFAYAEARDAERTSEATFVGPDKGTPMRNPSGGEPADRTSLAGPGRPLRKVKAARP